MNQRQPDIDLLTPGNVLALENALKNVWEKVRISQERLQSLRQANDTFAHRVAELEQEVGKLRSDLSQREQELRKARGDYASLAQSDGRSSLSEDEKEALKTRIKELIVKINSHL